MAICLSLAHERSAYYGHEVPPHTEDTKKHARARTRLVEPKVGWDFGLGPNHTLCRRVFYPQTLWIERRESENGGVPFCVSQREPRWEQPD